MDDVQGSGHPYRSSNRGRSVGRSVDFFRFVLQRLGKGFLIFGVVKTTAETRIR